jgi:anti-anti-sigma factor
MELTINSKHENGVLSVELVGDLDTNTAADAQEELLQLVVGSVPIVFDFNSLNYISSAGLRLLLILQKEVESAGGSLSIINMPDKIRDIFEMVAFSKLFTIN